MYSIGRNQEIKYILAIASSGSVSDAAKTIYRSRHFQSIYVSVRKNWQSSI